MKLALTMLAILLLLSASSAIKTKSKNHLEWNEYAPLAWSDFQGSVNVHSHGDAASTISIRATPYYKNRKLVYEVKALFIKDQSWYKSSSARLLHHEQLHFDLAELYARRVRKKISEYRQMGVHDVTEINKALSKVLQESNTEDRRFDAETLHGALAHKEKMWAKEIKEELFVLRKFSKENWIN
jgi:predicted secreted Zn-dependent protease